MKIKTTELQGEALNWVVEECEQFVEDEFEPSENWADGGPIIEREWLDVTPWPNESDEDMRWQCKQHDNIDCVAFGPTPLIAAMRCYVASKLGEEVEVPDEMAS
jgi:hypothetical protein